MCAGMIDLKKALTKITELEEELKSTCDGYQEEMTTLVEKNDDLKKKLKVFIGFPATGGEDDDCTCLENYIIIDDTDSDPDDSDDDFVDEAGADIMESSTDLFFQSTTITVVVFLHVVQSEHFCNDRQTVVCPCLN